MIHYSGTITYFGVENPKSFSKESTKLLKNKIGYLFQNFALIESKTVEQNLMIALEFVKGIDKKKRIEEVVLCQEVGQYKQI